MGYDTRELRVSLLLDNHNGRQQIIDRQEAENLAAEIRALLLKPHYARIARLGVDGP